MTEADLFALVRDRHPMPEWVCLPRVADGTGFARGGRIADAVAMNCFPSRGWEIHGFEIKVSRSDWGRELKNPDKAESMWRYCDRWWVVAPRGVVDPKELPKTWGLYEPAADGLRAKVKAPLTKATRIDRGFMASMLRNALDGFGDARPTVLRAIHDAVREESRRDRARSEEYARAAQKDELSRLEDTIKTAEAAAGCNITSWNAKQVGGLVGVILRHGSGDLVSSLKALIHHAERIVETNQAAVDDIKKTLEELKAHGSA